MANPYFHACSSVKRWGGEPEDYLEVHQWFDETKASCPHVQHRALRHHAEGVFLCERIFGPIGVTSTGRKVPTREIGEQHIIEDCGRVPLASEWLENMKIQPWMLKSVPLSDQYQ